MDTRAFYSARKITDVSTLAEVNKTMEIAKNVVNVVVLPPEAGDSGSQETDVGDVADILEEIFVPAGEPCEMLNGNQIHFGIFNKLLIVNESMVLYFGRHSAKRFIRGKPIRFGFKIWCFCGSDDYPYNMNFIKERRKSCKTNLGSRVINNMVEVITANSSALLHELYFDNFFTSYSLMSDSAKIDVRATGTIRENRTAVPIKR